MTRRNLLQLIAFLLPILRKLFEGPRTPELAANPSRLVLHDRCPELEAQLRKRKFLKLLQEKGYITLNATGKDWAVSK